MKFRVWLFHLPDAAIWSTPHCPSSVGCINEHLATDSGGIVLVDFLCSNCAMIEFFPEKSSKYIWN